MASEERRMLIINFMDMLIERLANNSSSKAKEAVKMAKQSKENLLNGNCIVCGESIDMSEFKDRLSLDEFSISHTCQSCQDNSPTLTDEDKKRRRLNCSHLIVQ